MGVLSINVCFICAVLMFCPSTLGLALHPGSWSTGYQLSFPRSAWECFWDALRPVTRDAERLERRANAERRDDGRSVSRSRRQDCSRADAKLTSHCLDWS
jgi:hypothetical protein